MATTVPPRRPTPPPPASQPPGGRAARRAVSTRALAGGLLAAVVVVVLILLLSGGGGATYYLIFPENNQLVRGDQVQVGGVPVGSVNDITLLHDYQVKITIHVNSSLTPLHEGTTAEVRVPSLSSVANRYILLTPGPNNNPALANGATLPASATKGTTDLDQLFDTFNPQTRKGLQEWFQGSAEQYAGAGAALQLDAIYFSPSLEAIDHVFAELSREQPTLTRFLVETAKATTTIAARSHDLTELVSHADTTFAALGSHQEDLAQGFKALPTFFKEGNRTFEELPSTLADLGKLVEVAKKDTTGLPAFFSKLTTLATAGTPVLTNFSEAISRPGKNNDLTEVALALPGVAKALVTASPDGVRADEESLPVTALFGPYSPDLQGLIRDFGQGTAYYDANGHYARVGGIFPDFQLGENDTLKPVNPAQVVQGLKTGQLRRCPGAGTQPAEDGSSPFTDNGALSCDPTETP